MSNNCVLFLLLFVLIDGIVLYIKIVMFSSSVWQVVEMSSGKFQFAIDRGGTFTDVWARCPSGKTRVMKLLSEDPANYLDAPREGIQRILQQVSSVIVTDLPY